jgi:hypothetical protein
MFTKAAHKYTLVKNGKKQETGWVEVDEEDYWEYVNYLGMEIVSKPYGVFEDEKIKEPSPPGMAFVGNERYGEWRQDPATGRSFWHYYGLYSFFMGGRGRYYYRDDWNTWRNGYRNRRPYYGGSVSTGPIYGTGGSWVRTQGRYRNTDFVRRGGLKAAPPSIRGAGAARRGGGPGGGGK